MDAYRSHFQDFRYEFLVTTISMCLTSSTSSTLMFIYLIRSKKIEEKNVRGIHKKCILMNNQKVGNILNKLIKILLIITPHQLSINMCCKTIRELDLFLINYILEI